MTEQLNNITVLVPVAQRSDCIVLTVSFYIEKIFIYFGCAGSSLLHGLFSSCSEQGLLSGCSVWVSHCGGFSCCSTWALGGRAQWLGHMGLVAQQYVGSSGTRNQTCVPCVGRRILNQWTTEEVFEFFKSHTVVS